MFLEASYATAHPIYGSITLLNTSLVGIVTLGYQTVGGEWVPNDAVVAEILADRLNNPRTTSWEKVAHLPATFPPIAHEYDLINMKGMDEVVAALNAVTSAILTNSGSNLTAHKADLNNPHGVTAAQTGAYDKAQADAKAQALITSAMAQHVAQYHS